MVHGRMARTDTKRASLWPCMASRDWRSIHPFGSEAASSIALKLHILRQPWGRCMLYTFKSLQHPAHSDNYVLKFALIYVQDAAASGQSWCDRPVAASWRFLPTSLLPYLEAPLSFRYLLLWESLRRVSAGIILYSTVHQNRFTSPR